MPKPPVSGRDVRMQPGTIQNGCLSDSAREKLPFIPRIKHQIEVLPRVDRDGGWRSFHRYA